MCIGLIDNEADSDPSYSDCYENRVYNT